MSIRQDIRFCSTADGVQLAMALYGSGAPLVKAATWLTHVERDPASGLNRPWIKELSRNRQYVTYDARGCGLSSREVADISFEAWVNDLETVVDSLGLERFPLLGMSQGAPIAIAYAARHPERVSRLVLVGPYATSYYTSGNPDPRIVEEAETLLKVMQLGWGRGGSAFSRVFVSKLMPGASPELQREFNEYQLATATPDAAVRSLRAMYSVNVKEEARKVACPTLIFHARNDQSINFEQGRKVAALIPGARFVPLDSDNHLPLEAEACWPRVFQEVSEFLGDTGMAGGEAASLTARQTEVLRHVATGKTDKQIARDLGLSPRTIEMHVAGAMKALDCATRAEAVARAGHAGLLPH